MGYVAKDRILVITDASGPGPRAILARYSVTIDGKHAQRFCDRVIRESVGQIDYVGDWHKHTGISLRPSEQDALAIKIMANFEFSPTRRPISLIFRAWPEAFRIYVWDGVGLKTKVSTTVSKENCY